MLPSLGEETTNDSQSVQEVQEQQKNENRVLRSWNDYWDSSQDIEIAERNGTFRVYEAGSSKSPQIFLLHGGGYTALSWSLVAARLKDRFCITAMDIRGHGSTTTHDDLDLSVHTLTEDVVAVWNKLASKDESDAQRPVLFAGHSMGAAIAVRAASSGQIAALQGVIVIDVVEGTALASLPYMKTVLNKRPRSFASVHAAIDWALSSKMCRNEESACISVPSMLSRSDAEWKWRTPLLQSEPYWSEWYQGLSQLFLALPVPKLLCLAGTDRLDKTLTVGQMQGKFQLALMPTSGHAIHEDDPDRVSELLAKFIDKFRIGQSRLSFLRPT